MANPTHITDKDLESLAASYPSHVAWLWCDDDVSTELTLTPQLLSGDAAVFPLMARIQVYDGGKLIHEFFSEEITAERTQRISFNEILLGKKLSHAGPVSALVDAYAEITVFSLTAAGQRHAYFGEQWCTVLSRSGRMAFNYPPLNFKGVDVRMLDPLYLYYPGVIVDENFSANVVLLNQYDFDSHADVILHSSDGKSKLQKRFSIGKKSCLKIELDREFPEAQQFFGGQSGLLLVNFPFKMNGFVQNVQRQTRAIGGMDHLGYLSTYDPNPPEKVLSADDVHARRLEDEIVCFCRSVPASYIKTCRTQGKNLKEVMTCSGAGTVCHGCVVEMRKFFA